LSIIFIFFELPRQSYISVCAGRERERKKEFEKRGEGRIMDRK
jgi:hypothetical protein